MKKTHITGYACTCAILIMALIHSPGSAAATIMPSNGTMTSFDAVTGSLLFEWDQNSQYDITGTDVVLLTDDIFNFRGRLLGTVYEFVIPNFYDPLPLKTIDITMAGANAGASGFSLPFVLDIIGADSDYLNGGPALPVFGSFVSGTTSPTLVTEYWEMFPNPDFEIVKLYVPVEFELQSITIATQSTVIPLPASVWLFGSGILGLAGLARKKKAA